VASYIALRAGGVTVISCVLLLRLLYRNEAH
jgi:hypothetical protein